MAEQCWRGSLPRNIYRGVPAVSLFCIQQGAELRASQATLQAATILFGHRTDRMKYLILITVLASFVEMSGGGRLVEAGAQSSSQSAASSPSMPGDQENARKARALLDQAIHALGGQAFLDIHDKQEEGRTYSFHHGQPTSNGVLFWRFVEYPNKEPIEVTKQRDIAYLYAGDKGYEITYKGPHGIE